MRSSIVVFLTFCSFFLLTGCWDKSELTELGIVQAVAIDQTEDDQIQLTTHFFKPTGVGEGGAGTAQGGQSTSVNIKTRADTVPEAVRDIPIELGRRAKWDHMRVLLIGEQSVKKRHITNMLDFFRRDYEPRGTVLVIITSGQASDYLNKNPIIEQTMGQHLRNIGEMVSRLTGKTVETTLQDLDIQSKSEVGVAMLPYVYTNQDQPETVSIAGIALLKKGKMVDLISPKDAERLLMLTDQYESGSIEIPCHEERKRNSKESFEVTYTKTKVTPVIQGDSLTVHVLTKIEGSPFDLHCSSLETPQEERVYAAKIKKTVEQDLRQVVKHLQEQKVDVIGIGNKIYGQDPLLWKQWKSNWDEHFAHSRFKIDVEVRITDTGMSVGKPFSK